MSITSIFLPCFEPESGCIKRYASNISSLATVNVFIHNIFKSILENLKSTFTQVNKDYVFYVNYFDKPGITTKDREELGNLYLLDALSSGYHLHKKQISGRLAFTPKVGEDIKTLVELMPKSVHFPLKGAFLNPFDAYSPLAIASINANIPLNVVEFLLQKGADPEKSKEYFQKELSLIHPDRLIAVLKLFQKYKVAQNS